ncbi:hypothetical protein F383_12163 [Gossypium arboreum]|uniref:Uncharacterized protein n=1 Tax=Gossypium arboreum TaxID=29729 RepID=A0A0B0NEK2_GOSAR|nr:hypothetical protein F383_12163 [Gossypium arboreum]
MYPCYDELTDKESRLNLKNS